MQQSLDSPLCSAPRGAGKPINTSQPVNLSAPARSVFASTAQDHYQIHQTGFCVIPALARSSGQYQGKSNYQYKKSLSCAQKQRPSRHRLNTLSVALKRQTVTLRILPFLNFSQVDLVRPSPVLKQTPPPTSQILPQTKPLHSHPCPSLSQARPDLMHLETYLNRNPYTNRSPCQYLNQKLHPVVARSLVSPPSPNPKVPQSEPCFFAQLQFVLFQSSLRRPKIEAQIPVLKPAPDSLAPRLPVAS
ncbi:hypothetical protein RSOL_449680, partial [Rhizoctonia solani AG-3 Rhs1AP]